MRRGIATTTLVTAGLAAAFAAPAAAQSAPAFTCEAFALRATVLGQAIEPVVYGRGQECRTGQATPTGALRALLPNGALPPELLSAELLSSTAGATCADGALALNGSSTITGVKLLGRPIDLDTPLQQDINVLDSASITYRASGNRVVARARVARKGAFETTAALPGAKVRRTDASRYTAVRGRERSLAPRRSRCRAAWTSTAASTTRRTVSAHERQRGCRSWALGAWRSCS